MRLGEQTALDLTLSLPRSIEFGPFLTPPSGALVVAVIQCQPRPVNPVQGLQRYQSQSSEVLEYAFCDLHQKTSRCKITCAYVCLIQGIPARPVCNTNNILLIDAKLLTCGVVQPQWMQLASRHQFSNCLRIYLGNFLPLLCLSTP